MNKLFLHVSLIMMMLFAMPTSFSQVFYGGDASRIIDGAQQVWLKEGMGMPSHIVFYPDNRIPSGDIDHWLQRQFGFDEDFQLIPVSEEFGQDNYTHQRVKLSYKNVPIFDGMLVLHIKNDSVYSINGDILSTLTITNSPILFDDAARQIAISHVNAVRYKWQMPEEEALLKKMTDNSTATYFPEARKKLFRPFGESEYRYVYVFDIYADEPLYRADVFVDAYSGDVLWEHNKIHETDVLGIAVTKYSGTQTITTDSTGTTYRLRQTGRGNGVETYNMQRGTNYGNAVDFTDNDNYWNNFNANLDEVATDAHWGTEMTYDYFFDRFNRNSIDGNGFKLMSYVHYGNNYVNAFWDGQRMTYGDGNGSNITPLTALDIIAHEITHGLTSFTANLVYQNEPGALNEAFSDIFGAAVEWYAKPASANWLIGEDIGIVIRSMSNPKSRGLPDTYHGINWYFGTGDNGGVHTNNGPLCYWFYLISEGGSGTNDNADQYSVSAISIDSAATIAYRMLTVYLTNTSEYIDARYYGIQSAIDLFGPCSPQVEAVTDAFYAIGVGDPYIPHVISDFSAPLTEFCAAPATVSFKNESNNGLNYFWDFGDGITSTDENPVHTYNSQGTYTVTLMVDGGACGSDTLIEVDYISIDSQHPCVYNMPQNGIITTDQCFGFLYDSGGEQNYHNNTNGVFIIAPHGAMSITLNFQSFSFEQGYDYLYIYDGYGINAPLIGRYDGDNLPNGGTITSSGGSITLRQSTDQFVTEPGFLLGWTCDYPTAAPVADFIVSDTLSCTGEVILMDISTNGPSSWYWDLGDGTTATSRIVNHTYNSSGSYTVKLVTTNQFGGDTIVKKSIIRVRLPYPDVGSKAVCYSGVVTLVNPDTTVTTRWYEDQYAADPIHTGHSFTTPVLNQSTVYYAEEELARPQYTGGKPSNAGSGGYFNHAVRHYLVFDAHKPAILHTVNVYAGSAGDRTIQLRNSSNNLLQSKTVTLVQGINTVTLDFSIPAENGLRLVGPISPNLYRNSSGINYPYQIEDIITITHSSASSNPTGYYYYFYQWVVSEPPCVSDRIPVEVVVSNAAPIVDFNYSINDATVSFNDQTVNKGINRWNFGDGNYGTGAAPVHHYAAIGDYEVWLSVDNGCGIDSIAKTVQITSISIEKFSAAVDLKVFPNPSAGRFTVILPQPLIYDMPQLILYDLLGKEVTFDVISNSDNEVIINADNVKPGIYILYLISDGKVYRTKVSMI